MAITYVSSSTGAGDTGATVPAPASLAAGNLLVALIFSGDNQGSFSAPTGWAKAGASTFVNGAAAVYTKTATATEPTSYTFTIGLASAVVLQYSGATGLDGTPKFQTGTTNPATTAALTAAAAGERLVIGFGSVSGYDFTTPSGTTARASATDGSGSSLYVDDMAVSSAGTVAATSANGEIVPGTAFGAGWTSVAFLLAPAAGGGATNVTAAGVLATATASAPAGTVATTRAVTATGPLSTATASAAAGSVTVGHGAAPAGPLATAAATAPAGTVTATTSVTVTAPAATATATAPAGTVAAGHGPTLAGPTATVTATAPAGTADETANVTLTGPPATATAVGLAGTAAETSNVTVTAPAATATAVGLAGGVGASGSATITGPVATAAASAPAGAATVGHGAAVAGPLAQATATAPAGTVATTAAVTVTGPLTVATAAAPAGGVVTDMSIAGLLAVAEAQALAGLVRLTGPLRDITITVGALGARTLRGALGARTLTGRLET